LKEGKEDLTVREAYTDLIAVPQREWIKRVDLRISDPIKAERMVSPL
jgi:hypothetical protein